MNVFLCSLGERSFRAARARSTRHSTYFRTPPAPSFSQGEPSTATIPYRRMIIVNSYSSSSFGLTPPRTATRASFLLEAATGPCWKAAAGGAPTKALARGSRPSAIHTRAMAPTQVCLAPAAMKGARDAGEDQKLCALLKDSEHINERAAALCGRHMYHDASSFFSASKRSAKERCVCHRHRPNDANLCIARTP